MSSPSEVSMAAEWRGVDRPGFSTAAEPARDDATAAPVASEITARLHRSLDTLAPLWARFEREGASTAYQRRDWMTCMHEHLAGPAGATPLFVEVMDAGGRSLMLMAFALTRRFGISVLSGFDLGVCDYTAPLLAPGIEVSPDMARRVWAAVRTVLPHADVVDLRQIPLDVGGVPNPFALLPQCSPMDLQAFGMALDGDIETLVLRLMGVKPHREMLRRRRRLERHGDVRFVEARTEAELSTMFAVMCEQRRRRFQKLGRFDLLSRPEVEAFYREAAVRSLRGEGPVRVCGLAVGDQWVATAYMLVHARMVHGIILGIGDESWNKCGPGVLMATTLMEWSLGQGCTYFDMTVGNLPYKAALGANPRNLYRILEARSRRGAWALRATLGAAALMSWIRSRPKLFGTVRTVRQRMRRLANRN